MSRSTKFGVPDDDPSSAPRNDSDYQPRNLQAYSSPAAGLIVTRAAPMSVK
jgi:hypothetical protein